MWHKVVLLRVQSENFGEREKGREKCFKSGRECDKREKSTGLLALEP